MNVNPEDTEKILADSRSLIARYPLCNSCLGRQFALLGSSLTNFDRGVSIKTLLLMSTYQKDKEMDEESKRMITALATTGFNPAAELSGRLNMKIEGVDQHGRCFICGSLLQNLAKYTERITSSLVEYEHRTFLLGCKISNEMIEREDAIRGKFNLEFGESIKNEITRRLGKMVEAKTKAKYSREHPDLVVIVDLPHDTTTVHPRPIFVYGRYRKLARGIPQSTWLCPSCRGEGCGQCDGTGKKYEESVEKYVKDPLIEAFHGSEAKFHGAGREDIDVRVLGRGRPFIVQVNNPRIRSVDLNQMTQVVNSRSKGRVEVMGLEFTSKTRVRMLKTLAQISKKTYRGLIEFEEEVTEEEMNKIEEALNGAQIRQRTPSRVLHRRADKVRIKKVYRARARKSASKKSEISIRCQGGLYVKELITGDGGRTQPSVSSLLGKAIRRIELDVVEVEEIDYYP